MRLWITNVQLVTTYDPWDTDLSVLLADDAYVTRGDAFEVTEMSDKLSDACREHFRGKKGQPTHSVDDLVEDFHLMQFIEWKEVDNQWMEMWVVRYRNPEAVEIPCAVRYVKPKSTT